MNQKPTQNTDGNNHELKLIEFDQTKEFGTEDALRILDFFYNEAKKQLQLHNEIAVRARNEELTTSLSFYTRDFAINLSCEEEVVRKFYPCTVSLIRRSRRVVNQCRTIKNERRIAS